MNHRSFLPVSMMLACMLFMPQVVVGQPNKTGKIDEKLLKSLRKLDRIEGEAVYYAGVRGKFYALSREIVKQGSAEDFERMTGSADAIERAMGLYCLAEVAPDRAIPILKQRLESQASYLCFPSGCVGSHITEGEFAWWLLHNRRTLEMAEASPLLGPRELLQLDLEVLGTDECYDYYDSVRRQIEKRTGGITYSDARRTSQKDSSLLRLVKGVGRVNPTAETRQLLMEIAQDKSTELITRWAAASGLTRDVDSAVEKFLTKLSRTIAIPAHDLRPRGFLQRLSDRRDRKTALQKYDMADKRRFDSDEDDDSPEVMALEKARTRALIQVFSQSSPIAVVDVEYALRTDMAVEDRAFRRAMARATVEISRRLTEVAAVWDTDSDGILRLDGLIHDEHGTLLQDSRLVEILGKRRTKEVSQNILHAKEKLQEGWRQLEAGRP